MSRPHHTRRLTKSERRRRAEIWLRHASKKVTPEAVAALAPYVGRYEAGSPYAHAANDLVSQGAIPTHARVQERAAQLKEARIARAERRKTVLGYEVLELDERQHQHLCEYISAHRAEHGTGPSWVAVGEYMGWTRGQVVGTLQQLRREGVISFTRAPGSLSVSEPRAPQPDGLPADEGCATPLTSVTTGTGQDPVRA